MSPQFYCSKCVSNIYGENRKDECIVCFKRSICRQIIFQMYLKAIYHIAVPYELLCIIANYAIESKPQLPLIHQVVWKIYNHGTINIPSFVKQSCEMFQMKIIKNTRYLTLENYRKFIKYNNHPYLYDELN